MIKAAVLTPAPTTTPLTSSNEHRQTYLQLP